MCLCMCVCACSPPMDSPASIIQNLVELHLSPFNPPLELLLCPFFALMLISALSQSTALKFWEWEEKAMEGGINFGPR